MNAHISTRDDHPFVAIMAFPDKWLSLFDVEKLFKAQVGKYFTGQDIEGNSILPSGA
jgi:hypothetical protein